MAFFKRLSFSAGTTYMILNVSQFFTYLKRKTRVEHIFPKIIYEQSIQVEISESSLEIIEILRNQTIGSF